MKLYEKVYLSKIIYLLLIFAVSCAEDEKADETYTLDNLPPLENNGSFSGSVGQNNFSASHVAAGIYRNEQLITSGVVSISGLRIAGTDTTQISMVLTGEVSKLTTNTAYSNSSSNTVDGIIYNSTQNSVGAGEGTLTLTTFDRQVQRYPICRLG